MLSVDAGDFFDRAQEEPVLSPTQPSPRSNPTTPRDAPAASSIPAEKNEDKIQQALSVGNYSAALDACFEVLAHQHFPLYVNPRTFLRM